MPHSRRLIAAALLLVLSACGDRHRAPKVEEIASPAGTGAAEPFLFPTRDGGVLLSWLEPVANSDRVALRHARLRGGRWSAPRTIVERNDLFVNWADFPSVVEDGSGALYAHWLQKSGPGTYSYDVRMSVSSDGGAAWSAPFLLNRDGKQAEHGFVSLVPLPGGGVGATWLDGRNMSAGQGHDHGDMSLRYATVSARGEIAEDVQLDARTCECCTTGMTLTGAGPVIVYRDRSPDEIRDISLVRKTAQGWSVPKSIHPEGWKIAGCPVNGPQIDAIGSRAAVASFTAARGESRVWTSFSEDGGATFGKPAVVDDGKPLGRVDLVLLDEHTALVSWLEQTAGGAEIRARRVTCHGEMSPSFKVAESSTARASGFTRMARAGEGVYIAWTAQSGESKRVHVARIRL